MYMEKIIIPSGCYLRIPQEACFCVICASIIHKMDYLNLYANLLSLFYEHNVNFISESRLYVKKITIASGSFISFSQEACFCATYVPMIHKMHFFNQCANLLSIVYGLNTKFYLWIQNACLKITIPIGPFISFSQETFSVWYALMIRTTHYLN